MATEAARRLGDDVRLRAVRAPGGRADAGRLRRSDDDRARTVREDEGGAAVGRVHEAAQLLDADHEALRLAGVTVDQLDAFIPHQANLRITQTLARNIQLPDTVAVATDIVDTGNTSAASVPLAMEAMLRHDEASVGDTALLIAFGAGLSYAGQVVTLPPLA